MVGRRRTLAGMSGDDHWPPAQVLETPRLVIESLRVDHAEEMAPLLDDAALYAFTGGTPPALDDLRERYEVRLTGEGSERWRNWVARRRDDGRAVGGLQAELETSAGGTVCELAWIVGTRFQGLGYAREGATAMVAWLDRHGAAQLLADIHPGNEASMGVARWVGLSCTGEVVERGDVRWGRPAAR